MVTEKQSIAEVIVTSHLFWEVDTNVIWENCWNEGSSTLPFLCLLQEKKTVRMLPIHFMLMIKQTARAHKVQKRLLSSPMHQKLTAPDPPSAFLTLSIASLCLLTTNLKFSSLSLVWQA